MNWKLVASTAIASVLLVGCASVNDPVHLGGGKYSLSASNYWAWSGADQQSGAIAEANKFCAQKGKVARVTSMQATDAIAYARVASANITFVCEDAESMDEPVEMANGVYMLAGSSEGYQGIKARYKLMQQASKFCSKQGKKPQMIDATREFGMDFTSITGKTSASNSANSALQNTSADIFFICK